MTLVMSACNDFIGSEQADVVVMLLVGDGPHVINALRLRVDGRRVRLNCAQESLPTASPRQPGSAALQGQMSAQGR